MEIKQMIEFCREKIIMANNPECKTYEEALYVEFDKIGCVIEAYHRYCTVGDGSSICEDYVILVQDGKWKTDGACGNEIRYFLQNQYQDCIHEYTILGLPLTLERVLVALNIGRIEEDEGLYFSNGLEIRAILVDQSYNRMRCKWQPNKTLECQNNETIEVIYKILSNDHN